MFILEFVRGEFILLIYLNAILSIVCMEKMSSVSELIYVYVISLRTMYCNQLMYAYGLTEDLDISFRISHSSCVHVFFQVISIFSRSLYISVANVYLSTSILVLLFSLTLSAYLCYCICSRVVALEILCEMLSLSGLLSLCWRV